MRQLSRQPLGSTQRKITMNPFRHTQIASRLFLILAFVLPLITMGCASTKPTNNFPALTWQKERIDKILLVVDVCIQGSRLGDKPSLHLSHNTEIGNALVDSISRRLAAKGYSPTKTFPSLVGFSATPNKYEVIRQINGSDTSVVGEPPFFIPPEFLSDSLITRSIESQKRYASQQASGGTAKDDTTRNDRLIDVKIYVSVHGTEVSAGKQAVGYFFSMITGGGAKASKSTHTVSINISDIDSGQSIYSNIAFAQARAPSIDNLVETIYGLLTDLPNRKKK
jgi:hypothetical protein